MPFSKWIPFLITIFLSHFVSAQQDLVSADFEKIIRGKDAFIIDEDLEINIHGKDRESTGYRFFTIRREVRVKIMNPNGVKRFSSIVLPEHFDPTYRPHASAVKKIGVYYSRFKILEFEAKIIRDKKEIKPKIKRNLLYKESFNIDYIYEYDQQVFEIRDLQVGDELIIEYDINIPYQENYSRFTSYRIFHHSDLPKKKYKLTITNHELLDIDYFVENGPQPLLKPDVDNLERRVWEMENLPGCLLEEGARPYLQLPYVSWVINHFQYFTHNSTAPINTPHHVITAQLRSKDLSDIIMAIEVGSTNKQFTPFNREYEKLLKEVPADYASFADYSVMKLLHTDIVENFKYNNSRDVYKKNDLRGERLGEFFEKEIIRDVSRYNIYYAMLVKSKTNFYSAFTVDKRFGVIGDSYFMPSFDSDYLLAAYLGEREFDLMLPKRHNVGWYYNEIPFYWEGTRAQLVDVSEYSRYQNDIKNNVRTVETQLTSPRDNSREIIHGAKVDLETGHVQHTGEIRLSGQFSTMNRMPYIKGPRDKTVNRHYNKTYWEIIPETDSAEILKSEVSPEYPFKASIEYKFTSNMVKKEGGEYIFDLSGHLAHIIPKLEPTEDRYLNYYSDFIGQDYHEIFYKFNEEVEMIDPTTLVKISNDFGEYWFQIVNVNGGILVNSRLIVRQDRVDVVDYENVTAIYDAVKDANSRKVRLTVN